MSIDKLREIIESSDNIVFFGGAGVSTESNIPDFRSETGLYSGSDGRGRRPEYMLSRTCFDTEREEFFDFYRSEMIHQDARPNKAHMVLAELERQGKLKAVITQNIDGLHQLAGSKNVLELHGSVLRNYCMDCGCFHDLDYIMGTSGIPKCRECGGVVKPDVVLYEEGLDMNVMTDAIGFIERADVLIVGGTSLTVYPAAGLIRYYRASNLVLINKTETPYSSEASLSFTDSIGEVLGQATDF